jgi:hypothetical protein
MKTTTKMTYQQALNFINGKSYKLDGVAGKLKVESTPYLKVEHVPSKAGMNCEAYLAVRRILRDDYTTDLTWSERLPEIMIAVGVVF